MHPSFSSLHGCLKSNTAVNFKCCCLVLGPILERLEVPELLLVQIQLS